MVNEYNKAAHAQNISSKMHAIIGNLLDPNDPSSSHLAGKEFFNFDIAVVSGGFHHFDDPSLAASRLAERLKPGGVLLVLDFMASDFEEMKAALVEGGDSADAEAMKTVVHMGFTEGGIKEVFEGAGVGGEFKFRLMEKVTMFGGEHGHGGGVEEKGVVGGKEEECKCGKDHSLKKQFVAVKKAIGYGHAHSHEHRHAQGHGHEGAGRVTLTRTPFLARGIRL